MARTHRRREVVIHVSGYRTGNGVWRFHVYPIINGKIYDNLTISFVVRKRKAVIDSWSSRGWRKHVVIPPTERERVVPGGRLTRSGLRSFIRNYAEYIYRKYYGINI